MSRRRVPPALRRVAAATSMILLATFAHALPAAAAPYQPGGAQKEPVVGGYTVKPSGTPEQETGKPFRPPAAVWPGRTSTEVTLPPVKTHGAHPGEAATAKAEGLPVWVSATGLSRVRVQSFDHTTARATGVDGLLMRVSQADSAAHGRKPAQVKVDYTGFRHAYGGDWANRLRLYALPECILIAPATSGCRPVEVPAVNDLKAGTISGTVDVAPLRTIFAPERGNLAGDEATVSEVTGGTLLAVAASADGASGNYKATDLSPSATWTAGGNTGDFAWSYPLRLPPSVGGSTPSIELNYSSSSVDGRMASSNNQPSWLGEGFDWHPGYLERRYNTCSEDMGSGANNTEKTGDQCWETDNASLSMSGHAGELIKDGSNPNRWHLRADDGTYIERKTGASNGDNNGEWWLVRTTDGTKYWFGGRSGSNSALTVPVFGNHSGEPCHQTAFANSHCMQAYRWQLDYVEDPFGNTITFTYAKETNKYGRNNKREDDTVYDRAGYPTKIEYGKNTAVSGTAPMRVLFTVADRCLSGCTTKDAQHWPDVPWDQECTGDTCDYTQLSPSFWTTKRLASIKTQVSNGLSYRDVESWTFTHSFPDPTDSNSAALWLAKISHQGLVGTATSIPDITLVGTALTNRVDTNDDQFPAMNRFRVQTINSESGGKLEVTYSAPDCVKGTRMPDKDNLHNNTLRCYPVKWTPSGHTKPIDDFFHKYLVTDVVEADIFGPSSRVITHYDYVGDPAWHYTDDDGFIKKDHKTWSVWRGYSTVRETKGDPGEQTREERHYFRGMHGDKLPSGTRTVTLPAIETGNIPAVNDEDAFAGMVRQKITYNGPGGAEVSATVSEPWQSSAKASRTINSHTVHARQVNTKAEHSRVALDGGRGHRTTTKTSVFDAYGMTIKSEDRGDNGVTGDEKCILTTYARNTSTWLLDRVSREQKFAVDCAKAEAGGLTAADVIEDTRTYFDDLAWNAAPAKGAATKVEVLKEYNSGSPTYLTQERSTYDVYGRERDSWDIRGAKTTTDYTPATGGPVTATKETNHLGWVKTTTLEPAWGSPLTLTDANGRKIDLAYDGLGRLTSVWLAGRDKATQTPNVTYEYLIRNNAPTVVISKRLNPDGGYITSYKLHDSLLRVRQTQDPDEAGGSGAVITDTFYDSAGREVKLHNSYLSPVAPGTNLFVPTTNIPSLVVTEYDGAGRETAKITKVDGPPASPGGTEKWRTTTRYGGDRVDVTPPAGGTASSTVTDASDNTVELREYHPGVTAGSPSGFDRTTYEYNRKDQLAKLIDAAGNQWTYEYDMRGNEIRTVDPDKGVTTTTYTDAGDVETTTDSRNVTIAYTYDELGRKKTLRDSSTTGPKRAEWVYDTLTNGTTVRGQLVKTIRYEGADQYIKEHVSYTVDYKPTAVRFTVPNNTTAGGVNGSYTYVYTFHPDGSPKTTRLPGMGDLGLETLTYGYNNLGKATTLSTSLGSTLVTAPGPNTPGTEYTSFGELAAIHLRHNSGLQADIVRTYDTGTRRLQQIWTTKASSPTTVSDARYSYDPQGNVTKISDVTASDHQCFATDHLQRLTEAWTPADGNCAATRSVGALGGPGKYWHSFKYDNVGNRTELVEHGTATGDRTTTYTVAPGKHRLNGTSTVDSAGSKTRSYTYDNAGNTLTRPTESAGTQNLTWDAEGRLASSTDSTGTTSYIYDVDGNRLLRKDPRGTTLYLPGQELRYNKSTGAKTCTRYYTHAEQTIAMRTAEGITWLSGDHHGTAQISIKAVGQEVAIRREAPFGSLRGTSGAWPAAMDKGFVGGTNDNTGLTHLGAREYDPLIGRFISVDPVIDEKDTQQLHGYSYANNSPITASDPDGLWPGWLDKAANAVKSAASSVVNAAASAGKWVYNNAGTISAVTGVIAVACSVIPPLQAVAPVFGAISAVTGAIDTYKSCSEGAGLDCAMGVAGMIPGARSVMGAGKGLYKGIKGAKDARGKLDDFYKDGKYGKRGTGKERRGLNRNVVRAEKQLSRAWAGVKPWGRSSKLFDDGSRFSRWAGNISLAENVAFEGCKAWFGCAGSRHAQFGWRPWWSKSWGSYRPKPKPYQPPRRSTASSYYRSKMMRFI